MKQYFHLTIGPVQAFVAQARRSKDLWSGSFLLSWLSAVAIASVRAQGTHNKIMFPVPDETFMQAVLGEIEQGPKQGGIPNRFKGVTAEVSEDFPASQVVTIVKLAWEQLAESVWQHDLRPFFSEHSEFDLSQSKEIWQRQIQHIWEISWALTNDSGLSNLLDRRKNWRNHYAPPEPGEKCMMMAGWQELSGGASAHYRREFWQALRAHLKFGKSDLEQDEQLCALAFIKRRFAVHFGQFAIEAKDWSALLQDNIAQHAPTLCGWSFASNNDDTNDYDPTHVPSLPYLAAMPYMQSAYKAIEHVPELLQSYSDFCNKSVSLLGRPSRFVNFTGLQNSAHNAGLPALVNQIDGISFYEGSLLAGQSYKEINTQDSVRRYQIFNHKAQLAPASPFYALLLMDGDSLGSQMSVPSKQAGISAALNEFNAKVPRIVQQHEGFLVYAGGDDVLALLPITSAINCARALEREYAACFEQAKGTTDLFSTLSGAIQFAHYRTPLMKIVSDAHILLDDVAKNLCGRHSLAVRIHKPGGLHAQWSMPWEKLYSSPSEPNILSQAVSLFASKPATITSKLLFKLQQVLDNLLTSQTDPNLLRQLAKAEYFHSGEQLHCNNDELRKDIEHIDDLLAACAHYTRAIEPNSNTAKITTHNTLQLDGLKLVRFLATRGQEHQEH